MNANPKPVKYLFFIVLLLFSLGCDSASKDLPALQQDSTERDDRSGSDTTIPDQETNNPEEVIFKIKVIEVFNTGKNICGAQRNNVMSAKVIDILKRGAYIIHMPKKEDVLLVDFVLAPKDLDPNMIIEVVAKESLCTDASKTYFTINSYKIIE